MLYMIDDLIGKAADLMGAVFGLLLLFCIGTACILMVAKVTEYSDISWWSVSAPLWCWMIFTVVFTVLIVGSGMVVAVLKAKREEL